MREAHIQWVRTVLPLSVKGYGLSPFWKIQPDSPLSFFRHKSNISHFFLKSQGMWLKLFNCFFFWGLCDLSWGEEGAIPFSHGVSRARAGAFWTSYAPHCWHCHLPIHHGEVDGAVALPTALPGSPVSTAWVECPAAVCRGWKSFVPVIVVCGGSATVGSFCWNAQDNKRSTSSTQLHLQKATAEEPAALQMNMQKLFCFCFAF